MSACSYLRMRPQAIYSDMIHFSVVQWTVARVIRLTYEQLPWYFCDNHLTRMLAAKEAKEMEAKAEALMSQ